MALVELEPGAVVERSYARPGRRLSNHQSRRRGPSVAFRCLLELSPLTARCGVDLREVGRLGVHGCAAVCDGASNHFPHADAPCAAPLLFDFPCPGRHRRVRGIGRVG